MLFVIRWSCSFSQSKYKEL